MAKRLDHDDAMELAVQLTCSYLSSSHSASTNAEELILNYYEQIRNVENRLAGGYAATREPEQEEEEAGNLTTV
jgi:hypothetical protein